MDKTSFYEVFFKCLKGNKYCRSKYVGRDKISQEEIRKCFKKRILLNILKER